MCAMARSYAARHSPGRQTALMLLRRVLCSRMARAAAAIAFVLAFAVTPLMAGAASAASSAGEASTVAGYPAAQRADAQGAGTAMQLTVSSLSPAYAEDGRTLTISGQVKNVSHSAVSGLSLQLWSSKSSFTSGDELSGYAHGSYIPPTEAPVPAAPITSKRLAAGHTWSWTARVPVNRLGLSCFGVYPLTVTLDDSLGVPVSRPVPLPFWPTKAKQCVSGSRPRPFPISWVWPLIDTPYQGPCPGLLSDGLQTSIAPGARLANLLAIGSKYASKAALTWAVDPALLGNVKTMTSPYVVGDSPSCTQARPEPASSAARSWLAALSKATTGQAMFVTPYADVDIAALVDAGNSNLSSAFTEGDRVARQVLGRSRPVELPAAGGRALASVAWPADGVASSSVLEQLAVHGVGTVILTMPSSSPVPYTPGAVTSVLTGTGQRLHVLLADYGITSLLASPSASSRQPAAQFQVSQLYLAETAQIAAEAPGRSRPIVVTPPRRWNPARSLANTLLADTVRAPWLSPTSTRQIVSQPAEHAYTSAQLTRSQRSRELSRPLLRRVARLDQKVALLENIRGVPDPALWQAVYGIESSRWRGGGEKQAQLMLTHTSQYVHSQLSSLSVGGNRSVTLGGKVSDLKVFIHNPLSYPVTLRLRVRASKYIRVTWNGKHTIPVSKNSYSTPIHLTVHALSTSPGTIRFSLAAPDGVPLPAAPFVMRIKTTDFGTVALVIFAAALAVFVIASAARAIRPGRGQSGLPVTGGPQAPAGSPAAGEPSSGAGSPGEHGPHRPADHSRQAYTGKQADDHSEQADDHSSAGEPAGRATLLPATGSAQERGNADYLGSVYSDGPQLTSAGRSVTDPEPTATGRRPTEER
jgi:hypothetical protein